MKNTIKLLSLLLLLLMLVQSTALSAFAFTPIDVTVDIYAAAGQPSKYSSQYNSGQRDVVATTLNGTSADAYYNGSYEYDVLSEKSATEIQNALATLMKTTHTYTSSYDDCHYKANRTDCENETGSSNQLSLIYTSYTATMSQWNGWNREHVWPKSLGGDTTSGGGADLHHIRPSDAGVNSSRGNKKYGNAPGGSSKYGSNPATGVLGGHYNSTYFEPLDNVKGDVARICLYVYVRWGSSWGATSITKVFQSIDVLLEWCELDPVDTWELGRNEVVEDIQGNRNVFIDYPEYAWLIFGREVPEDMVTPSGEAQTNAHHWDNGSVTTQATCTATGIKTYKCTDSGCGETKTEVIAALGHSWDNGSITSDATCTMTGIKTLTCSRCGSTKTQTINALGHSWDSGTVTTPPACTTTGVKTYTCPKCNGTKTEIIAALGHSYGDWIIDVEATETTTGSKHRVCSTCNNIETLTIPPIGHEHSYTAVVTPPTCITQGYTTHTCSCGEYYIDTYTPFANHTYKNGACTVCSQADPSVPTYTASDFENIANKLISGMYTGEERFNKLSEAIYIYSTLSDSAKSLVSGTYTVLKDVVSQYNDEASSVNAEAQNLNYSVSQVSMIEVTAVYFAVYSLLDKKYF